MKKVYFFIGTLSKGGAERTVSNLTLNLDPTIEKHIILFGTETRIDYPVEGQIHYIDQTKRNSVINKSLTLFRRIYRLRQLKKADPQATFISLLEYPNLINVLSGHPQRTILSVRNHMSTKHRKGIKAWFWKRMIRLTYNHAQTIIAVSEDIRSDLIHTFGIHSNKIQVFYNAYELDSIRKAARKPLPPQDKALFNSPAILSMGRMNQQKGQWHLIRSFQSVVEQVPQAQLIILGEGQNLAALQKLAIDCNLQASVHFPGFQSNPYQWISQAQAFVLSSLYEGFPNALAEAMACGIPVISTDCHSGPREILAPLELDQTDPEYGVQPGRFGLLYPVDSSKFWTASEPLTDSETQLAQLMIQMLTLPELRESFAELAAKRIADFDIKNIVHNWESLI